MSEKKAHERGLKKKGRPFSADEKLKKFVVSSTRVPLPKSMQPKRKTDK